MINAIALTLALRIQSTAGAVQRSIHRHVRRAPDTPAAGSCCSCPAAARRRAAAGLQHHELDFEAGFQSKPESVLQRRQAALQRCAGAAVPRQTCGGAHCSGGSMGACLLDCSGARVHWWDRE